MIEICGIGGYSEVGKNMTAVKFNGDAVLFDMGYYMQKLMDFEESGGDRRTLNYKSMIQLGMIPDDRIIDSWKNNVKAIIPSHCHLDHIGAIPFMAPNYKAPVIGSPYTIEVLKNSIKDEEYNVPNEIKTLKTGKLMKISNDVSVELIHVTHSTPDSTIVAVHTPKGIILYANDFKLDDTPTLGKKPDYDRLKELGETGKVKAIIMDALYSGANRRTPSEKVAREGVEEVVVDKINEGNAIFASCFASHIARLKSFADFGRQIDRKVVFLGRSMSKYVNSAEELGIASLPGVEIIPYRAKIEKFLKKMKDKGPEKYLIVATGGQGEPNSVLSRILKGSLHFKFTPNDTMIFSNMVIPVEPNIMNRVEMEKAFKQQGVRVVTSATNPNVHVSGHGSLKDMEELIKMVNPENIIPSHGDLKKTEPLTKLTDKLGYRVGKELHLIENQTKIELK
ncbi:MAG: MBL fold metallo-hydrolase RNA specificity domain-containing protein [Candidatus Nanoarchaeia archaeon]|nr:MBL fold metallo-hydrolase RNA specificity domain-containing protein [Candidatus Nanoarchaeia archaeon]